MQSLTILSPTSALFLDAATNTRVQLGASAVSSLDVDVIFVLRVSVEEIAGLPMTLRDRHKGRPLQVACTNHPRLAELLKHDECCEVRDKAQEATVPLDQYGQMKAMDGFQVSNSDSGWAIIPQRTSWMRRNDTIATMITLWDVAGAHSSLLAQTFCDGNQKAAEELEDVHKGRAEKLSEIKSRYQMLRQEPPREELAKFAPLYRSYLFAPFATEQPTGYHHLITTRRAPYDISQPLRKPDMINALFAEHLIGREVYL